MEKAYVRGGGACVTNAVANRAECMEAAKTRLKQGTFRKRVKRGRRVGRLRIMREGANETQATTAYK